MNQAEAEYLALLVHKGFVDADAARGALASRADDETLPALLGRLGLLELSEAERLFANRVGEAPSFSRYEVVERLGEGATAIVFEAIDRKEDQRVALKVLREEVARQPKQLKRFIDESQLLCRLHHAHLVTGKRVARDKGVVFLAMELLPRETLEDRLIEGERYAEDDALRYVYQVAQVLDYLRSEGFVHRDLKPGNMILDENRVVLIDLGFAAKVGEEHGGETTVGTVQYIAPEQARGESDLDARADIYSLGATLYHLVVGEPPFAGEDNREVLLKQVYAEISSSKIRELGLSPQLHYFIEKMMAKDRAVRYQTPADVVSDLESKLGDDLLPVLEDEVSPVIKRSSRTRKARSRRRRR